MHPEMKKIYQKKHESGARPMQLDPNEGQLSTFKCPS